MPRFCFLSSAVDLAVENKVVALSLAPASETELVVVSVASFPLSRLMTEETSDATAFLGGPPSKPVIPKGAYVIRV